MSTVASGTSPASDETAVAQSQAHRSRRGASWAFSRLLVTLGVFVFAYAAWIPWEVIRLNEQVNGTPIFTPIGLTLSLVLIARFLHPLDLTAATFWASLLLVIGPLLSPLVWRRSDSLLGAIASHLLGVWIALAVAVTIWMRFPSISTLQLFLPGDADTPSSITFEPQAGFWLAVVALALALVGIALLLFSEWRAHVFWHGFPAHDGSRSRVSIPGVGLLTLGILLWAYGYLSTAWVTFNCTQTPLFFGTCQGYSANGVLGLTIGKWDVSVTQPGSGFDALGQPALLYISSDVARFAVPLLVGLGALLVIFGGWARPLTRTFTAWATVWLLGAAGFAVITYLGVTQLTASGAALPPGLTNPSGAVGIPATFIGLLLVLLALGALWFGAVTRRTA